MFYAKVQHGENSLTSKIYVSGEEKNASMKVISRFLTIYEVTCDTNRYSGRGQLLY